MPEIVDDVSVEVDTSSRVAKVQIHRPPNNFFDMKLIRRLAQAFRQFDDDTSVRAIVLCSEGKHFCAGADFGGQSTADPLDPQGAASLYYEAAQLFEARTPSISAVQGAAIGGGLGLACATDFRVGCPESRFASNFARLGFHQGFGLSITLPAIVGQQHALELMYTGARIGGERAREMGLLDRLVARDEVVAEATALAREIAGSAPLAVDSIRQTMRGHLAAQVLEITGHEDAEQVRLRQTKDFAEGIKATAERRPANFTGE